MRDAVGDVFAQLLTHDATPAQPDRAASVSLESDSSRDYLCADRIGEFGDVVAARASVASGSGRAARRACRSNQPE